ncbi:MAG: Fur family transcriptional regulator [Arenicellales bacterium]|nr:Fur family transcriptional regulator [Arenicellales bacterium]
MKEVSQPRQDLKTYLRKHGVTPTAQRIQIARILFAKPAHFSAEEIYNTVNQLRPRVSKATVYNTLGLFVRKGLIKEVLVDPSRVFYDSNTVPHHHFYDIDTGEIEDIKHDQISLKELPKLPGGKCLDSVEVLVRVRKQ